MFPFRDAGTHVQRVSQAAGGNKMLEMWGETHRGRECEREEREHSDIRTVKQNGREKERERHGNTGRSEDGGVGW